MKIKVEIELTDAFGVVEILEEMMKIKGEYYMPLMKNLIYDAMLDQATADQLRQSANETKHPF